MTTSRFSKITVFLFVFIIITLYGFQITPVKSMIGNLLDVVAPYDWYEYQGDKLIGGDCWDENSNCGPATVRMAIKYAKNKDVPITEIRTLMGGDCKSYTNADQIELALNNWNVNNEKLTNINQIINSLKNGNPVIAIVNMNGLTRSFHDWNTSLSDPFYNIDLYKNPGNHWLMFKGITSDEQWLIAYDPNVFDDNGVYFYNNWIPKGKDRLYKASEVGNNLLNGQANFEITDKPRSENFTGTVTNGLTPISNATVVFSDNHDPQGSILSGFNGYYSFNSFFHETAIVAAIKGDQIGAIKAQPFLTQTITLQSSTNEITIPQSGRIRVSFISTGSPGDQTGCSGTFGIVGGGVIFDDYLSYKGLIYDDPKFYDGMTSLVFYLTPSGFCAGPTFYSTDVTRAVIAHPTDETWVLSWEDFSDGDFNDLTVRIDLIPSVNPSLNSPVSNKLPRVEYYFDHKYPADPDVAIDSYPYAVTFSGFDDIEDYFLYQPYQSYSGNNGTDFIIEEGSNILPTADGVVTYAGIGSLYCPLQGIRKNVNVVKVRHNDGYSAEYWGIEKIDIGIKVNKEVSRDAGDVIGASGINPCTQNQGFHFVIKNPSGISVDPFGWKPLPDSHWYMVNDPWKEFQQIFGKDATSYLLWNIPSSKPNLINYKNENLVLSESEKISLTIPAYSFITNINVLIEELNDLPMLGGQPVYGSFIISGYSLGDQLVGKSNKGLTISCQLDSDNRAIFNSPVIYRFNHALVANNKWEPLVSEWDPSTGILRAESFEFGIFSIGEPPLNTFYLPFIKH